MRLFGIDLKLSSKLSQEAEILNAQPGSQQKQSRCQYLGHCLALLHSPSPGPSLPGRSLEL
jgi:hypothetical protein